MFDAVLQQTKRALALRRVLWGLLALPLTYLVGVNLFLNVGILPAIISAQPRHLKVSWGSAWSPWPGRAYVRGFYLRNEQDDVQFELTIDEAHTGVVLSALLSRRFETKWVRARGVEFRLRPRLVNNENAPTLAAPFPSIEGFASPPLEEHRVKEALPEAERWSVRLEEVTVEEVRQAWLGPYRAELEARVRGRMWLRQDGRLEVGPASLSIRRGEVKQGSLPVASALLGKLECTIEVPNVHLAPGLEVFRHIDATLQLAGELASLEWVNYHLMERAHPQLEGGRGSFKLGIDLARGFLGPGTQLSVGGSELAAELRGYRLRGGWNAHGVVLSQEGALRSSLELRMNPLRLESEKGKKLIESKQVLLSVTGSNVLVGELPKDAAVSLELSPTDPFPLELIDGALAGEAIALHGGTATARAKLSLGPGAKTRGGNLIVRTTPTEVAWGPHRVRGAATVDLDLARVRIARRSAELSGSSIELRDVSVVTPRAQPRHWWGKIRLPQAEIKLGKDLDLSAGIEGEFSDARPFLALFGDQAGIPRFATPLLEAEGLQLKGNMDLSQDRLQLRDVVAEGKGLSVRGLLDRGRVDTSGLFLVKVRGVGVGLKLEGKKLDTALIEPEAWFERQRAYGPR